MPFSFSANSINSTSAGLPSISPINLSIYGDGTGDSRRTSASRTDWQIVREFLGRYRDRFNDTVQVRSSNPPVKDRVNCVNAMLRNQAGQRRLLIDPDCKQLIQDFERVHWKSDPNGNLLGDIDKSDPMRSHASDALGYMIAREFPMRASAALPAAGLKLVAVRE